MPQPNDLSRSLTALDQDSTLIAVVEMSQSSWLVGAIIPGVERRPAKKLEASEGMLLALLHRWRDEAAKAGCTIDRITVAFEAGRDGFWLARWLRQRGIEAHVIHATSIALSREHRRAKTEVEVAPVWWTPMMLLREVSLWPRPIAPMRRSFGARWSSLCVPGVIRPIWLANSNPRPRRSAIGWPRPIGRTVAGRQSLPPMPA
jgi:hypothetical protein